MSIVVISKKKKNALASGYSALMKSTSPAICRDSTTNGFMLRGVILRKAKAYPRNNSAFPYKASAVRGWEGLLVCLCPGPPAPSPSIKRLLVHACIVQLPT